MTLSERSSDDPPTTLTFEIEVGQVWIDVDGTSWYVTSVGPESVVLERTITDHRTLRNLVLGSRRPNEKHPLHGGRDDA